MVQDQAAPEIVTYDFFTRAYTDFFFNPMSNKYQAYGLAIYASRSSTGLTGYSLSSLGQDGENN
jgi:hypothetical protein